MQTRWNDSRVVAQIESKVWTASATVRRYLHRLVSGNPNCDWPTYLEWRHLPPSLSRALVLGCGSGWLERGLAIRGRVQSIVACDFAADAVARAQAAAREAGLRPIEYRVVDLEKDPLPEGPYDAVFANDVLHHIADLEGLYGRIHEALAPEGKFLFNEYVGPNRFQYSEERMDLINRYFRLPGVLWRRERADPVKLAAGDPTEAVRSEDVLPLAHKFFLIEAEYAYGGGLLNPLLYEVMVNFDEGNPAHTRLLQVLCDAEDRLTRSGQLEPDFWIFVGRREDQDPDRRRRPSASAPARAVARSVAAEIAAPGRKPGAEYFNRTT